MQIMFPTVRVCVVIRPPKSTNANELLRLVDGMHISANFV